MLSGVYVNETNVRIASAAASLAASGAEIAYKFAPSNLAAGLASRGLAATAKIAATALAVTLGFSGAVTAGKVATATVKASTGQSGIEGGAKVTGNSIAAGIGQGGIVASVKVSSNSSAASVWQGGSATHAKSSEAAIAATPAATAATVSIGYPAGSTAFSIAAQFGISASVSGAKVASSQAIARISQHTQNLAFAVVPISAPYGRGPDLRIAKTSRPVSGPQQRIVLANITRPRRV